MQQLFGVVNQLLSHDDEARTRSLSIRTYKVQGRVWGTVGMDAPLKLLCVAGGSPGASRWHHRVGRQRAVTGGLFGHSAHWRTRSVSVSFSHPGVFFVCHLLTSSGLPSRAAITKVTGRQRSAGSAWTKPRWSETSGRSGTCLMK